MLVAALVVGAGVIVEVCSILKAPIGYQDETGFHIGTCSADRETRLWQNPS